MTVHKFSITLTYGRTLRYIRELSAASYGEATLLAQLMFPRASTITVE